MNIFRGCEDRFRQSLGLRGVGQGWISEAALFAGLKKSFPGEVVLQHAKPEWMGRQHLDIYFPRLNLAIEYQGVQHGRPLAIFGGEAGLRVRKRLDEKKKELCRANGCVLIEVLPDYTLEQVVEKIKAHAAKIPLQLAPTPAGTSDAKRLPLETTVPVRVDRKPSAKRHTSGSWKENLGKDDLAACARHGDAELIQRLSKDKAKVRAFRNSERETLLFIACKEGNIETAGALLDLGLDPNARDRRKASILSKICNRGTIRPKPEIVKLLIARGADPDLHGYAAQRIFDRCGYALPMLGCAIDGFLDCAKVLFEEVGTVNQRQPV